MCKPVCHLEAPQAAAEGATRKLTMPIIGERGFSWLSHAPWWLLWMAWPLFFLFKGALLLMAPLLGLLLQPMVFSVSPLALLLVGTGALFLVISALRRRSNPEEAGR